MDKKIISSLLSWIGILCLSISWYDLLPVLKQANYLEGGMLVGLGTIMVTIGWIKKEEVIKQDIKLKLFLLLPLILSTFILPFPYSIGPGVLTSGIILFLFFNRYNIWMGVTTSGMVLTVQALLMPFFIKIAPRIGDISLLLNPLHFLLNLIGYENTIFNNLLLLITETEVVRFRITPEKLGLLFLMTFFMGGFILIFLSSKEALVKKLVVFCLCLPFYVLLRILFLVLTYVEVRTLKIFWDSWWMFFSTLPLALILAKLCKVEFLTYGADIFNQLNKPILKKTVFTALIFFLAAFLLAGAIVFEDPGILKKGRVLIDEYHGTWESVTERLDTESYEGQKNVYTYYTLRKWLENYYMVDVNSEEPLESHLLRNYDVLILKCPTYSYSSKETEDILTFVKEGGGLLLIGDHTDLMGMNTNLNQIGKRIGINFGFDSTFDIESGSLSIYQNLGLSFYPPHPSIQQVPLFRFATSCSLSAPLRARDVITGYSLGCEEGSLSHPFFFGNMKADPQDKYGLFLQSVAFKLGKGRIFAFSDSTVFSSFSMMMKGNPEFFLGMMNYLNRINNKVDLNMVFLISSLFLFLLGIFLVKGQRFSWMVLISMAFFTFGLSISILTFNFINNVFYGEHPSPHTKYVEIAFDKEYSEYILHPSLGIPKGEKDWECFEGFFVSIQRLGYFPREKDAIMESLNSDLIVIINPTKSIRSKDMNQLRKYIEKGGKILILDSIRNKYSTSNELLSNFGMWIRTTQFDHYGNKIPSLTVIGGRKIIYNNEGIVSFATQSYGEGIIGVFVDSTALSKGSLGDLYSPSTEEEIEAYKMGYKIINYILKGNNSSKNK